jgi:hypothetical protein
MYSVFSLENRLNSELILMQKMVSTNGKTTWIGHQSIATTIS